MANFLNPLFFFLRCHNYITTVIKPTNIKNSMSFGSGLHLFGDQLITNYKTLNIYCHILKNQQNYKIPLLSFSVMANTKIMIK